MSEKFVDVSGKWKKVYIMEFMDFRNFNCSYKQASLALLVSKGQQCKLAMHAVVTQRRSDMITYTD